MMKKVFIASLFLMSSLAFAGGSDSKNNESATKTQSIDVSYTHFQKTGNVLLSVVPHNVKEFTLKVVDQDGKEVYSKDYQSDYIENIDLSHLSKNGIYTVTVSHNEIELQRSKVVL